MPKPPQPENVVEYRLKAIDAALTASPSKIVVLYTTGHKDTPPGSPLAASNIVGGPDHVAIAMNYKGERYFLEMAVHPEGGVPHLLLSKNTPGTLKQLVTNYDKVNAMALDLSKLGDGAADKFKATVLEGSKKSYGFDKSGLTCAELVHAGILAAKSSSFRGVVENIFETGFDIFKKLLLPGSFLTQALNTYTPLDTYRDASPYSVPVDFKGPDDVVDHVIVHYPGFEVEQSPWAEYSRKAYEVFAPDDDQGSLALSSARGDDAAQQPATEDDEEASREQVALASDDENAPTDDKATQQPATEDDEEASQEEVALAPDEEDARGDNYASQQPATDDDQDASQERAALVSDSGDAATDGAGVMETANAEAASVNSTGDADEAAAAPGQHATPASADMEQGFSFSMFDKQGIPIEFDKDTMPAEQVSPAADSTPAMPGSDAAHPDAGEDVGNAAPSKQPVVHHGDLAP